MKTNKPTPAAMRAASLLAELGYFRDACAANKMYAAQAIDHETGLPDLLTACERWIALRARCDAPGAGWSRIDREIEDGIQAEIEAALAKAKGGGA